MDGLGRHVDARGEQQAPAAGRHVLAFNSGSSSLKFGLYCVTPDQVACLLSGQAQDVGGAQARFVAHDAQGQVLAEEDGAMPDQRTAVARIGKLLAALQLHAPDGVGHRIVHGGPNLLAHGPITYQVMQDLQAAVAFSPLHGPAALQLVRYAQAHFPGVPQVACYDTAFHAELPEVARVLPIPLQWRRAGLHRYGFHGLSCESIVRQLGAALPARTIIAHLGNGASITALHNGSSADNSMGLTPCGGIMMGTRSGDLDPGLLLYLMREKHLNAVQLETLVEHQSGLLGVSGQSSNMQQLHELALHSPDARLAIAMFCYAVRKQIAGMMAAIEGADLIVFTGGIGEHDVRVRTEICRGLAWLGIKLDEPSNTSACSPISAQDSSCKVMVLTSQEDEQIALHTAQWL